LKDPKSKAGDWCKLGEEKKEGKEDNITIDIVAASEQLLWQ